MLLEIVFLSKIFSGNSEERIFSLEKNNTGHKRAFFENSTSIANFRHINEKKVPKKVILVCYIKICTIFSEY